MRRISPGVLAVAAPALGAVSAGAGVAADKGAPPEPDIPLVVLDETTGRWYLDKFYGNGSAGDRFYRGPAREEGDPWPNGPSACAWDGEHAVAVWQRHHIVKTVTFDNCDLIAGRVLSAE